MGIVCARPPRNLRARARHRLHSMAISMDAHHQLRHPSAAMSIGHLTKINTLVMVGPSSNEANFAASLNSPSALIQSAAFLVSRKAFARAKFTLELSMRQHSLIEKYWREHIGLRQRDIFHRTMLNVIEASPKVNEVIACQRYCFRDLTKWPKLNRICQAQFSFFEKLILILNLNEEKLLAECTRLGHTHARYAQHGLKPHFLDIFQHQFLGLLEKIDVENEAEKGEVIDAFAILTTFILDVLNHAYSLKMSELRFERSGGGGGRTGSH